LAFSISLLILFGDSDFSRLKLRGPYQVGYREFRMEKFGNEVSVYYPVDKPEYSMYMQKSLSNNTFWLRHGDHTLLGISKATAPIGRKNHINSCWLRHYRRIRMDIATDAPISSDFILD
jgi:hypothetical protein